MFGSIQSSNIDKSISIFASLAASIYEYSVEFTYRIILSNNRLYDCNHIMWQASQTNLHSPLVDHSASRTSVSKTTQYRVHRIFRFASNEPPWSTFCWPYFLSWIKIQTFAPITLYKANHIFFLHILKKRLRMNTK